MVGTWRRAIRLQRIYPALAAGGVSVPLISVFSMSILLGARPLLK
jgi:hypothetical protein